MKRFAWILVVMLASHAWAAKRVTVDQLEQILNASQGKSDAEVAWHLSDLELTERLSSTRLARWKASLPGDKVQEALVALADASEFRDPPAAEIPATAPPDVAAQRRMLALTVNYVGKTIPLLPNFFANMVTTRFEDTPLRQNLDHSTTPYRPLHSVGNSSATVTYRHGHEAVDTGATKYKKPEGLTTWGVFGPILGTVLEDAARSKLAWSLGNRVRAALWPFSATPCLKKSPTTEWISAVSSDKVRHAPRTYILLVRLSLTTGKSSSTLPAERSFA